VSHLKISTYTSSKNLPGTKGENTFHSEALFRVYEAAKGFTPIYFVAKRNQKIVARLLAIRLCTFHFFKVPLIHKVYIFGNGEYFEDKIEEADLFGEFLPYITKQLHNHASVIEFRNLSKGLFAYKYFRKNYYFPINWLCVRNSLHSDKLWDRISDSRKRQIKKGLNYGAQISEAKNMDEIHQLYRLLRKNYSAKFIRTLPSLSFFTYYFEQNELKPLFKTFLVKYRDNIIGASIVICSKKDMHILYSGGLSKSYYKLHPGVLAVWGAMEYGKKNNFQHLEFMNVGVPFRRHGYRQFISLFGGKQTSTRRWYRIKWKFLNKIAAKIYV
jgi:hypothetical protein